MTTTQHTPNGDTVSGMSVIPVLVYENIQAAHDFLIRAFGFTSGGIFRTDDGTVVHAEVRAGDCPIWLHRVTEEHEMASPKGARGSHGGLEVLVPDVDVHFAKAKDAGARIEREPTEQDYGLREYGARDPEDHRWWFSSPLAR